MKLIKINDDMKYYLLLIVVLGISCRTHEVETKVNRWESQAEKVNIHRDGFGVPHIYGKTDADAVFGLLFAQCEDDFKRVERNYIWAIGRLAEVEGEDAIYSDLRARMFMTKSEAIEHLENSPKWLQKLCMAFADGINYYLHTHPEVTPDLLTKFEPWMAMYFSEGSIGGDIERVSTKRIKAFYEEQKSLSLNEFGDGLIHPDYDAEPIGSNGIALAGNMTKSGNAMLLINPHTSFYFRGEVHVVSEEGLNAYGAVTWGQFFVYQGFNEKTGWMHTSTYTDVIDEFVETVEDEDGMLTYEYGDDERKVEQFEVVLKYKNGDKMSEREFPIYRTHHGPITHMIDDKWVSTAMMWSPVKALEQSYTRTKQTNHKDFYKMMGILTNSSNNTVYADADNNIAYYHGNFIPVRDLDFDYTKPVDGSDPETDWQGLHPVDEAITVINPPNGWIQNCNSTPFTSAAENSPNKLDYPRYMSIDRENFRGIHANRLLGKHKEFTIDKLIEMAYDPTLPAFEKIIPGLVQAYRKATNPNPELLGAINVLDQWNFKTATNSVGMTLAHFYGMTCLRKGKIPTELIGNARLNHFGIDAPNNERIELFQQTLSDLNSDFGSWNTPWGEINRLQRLSGDIDLKYDDSKPSIPIGMASSRWGALASFGARSFNGTKRIYGYAGNSFVAVVEFGEKVKAKSMLAGGQSGDPSSPHFYDQAQRYADCMFKDVLYYKEDVLAGAIRTYVPGR